MGNISFCCGGGFNKKLKDEKITFGEKEEIDLNNLSFESFRQRVLIDINYFGMFGNQDYYYFYVLYEKMKINFLRF